MDLPITVAPLWSDWWWITNAFKSFFHQVSTWDFSLLWYALIWVWFLVFALIVYLIISWKIRFSNLLFGHDYWVKFVVWDFWAWKTKNLFQFGYLWKKENPNWILIANIPYDFVDIPFDSKDDFDVLFKDLVEYIRDTNSVEFLKQWKEFPPILILCDEAHEYIFSRDFKNLTKDFVLVLTQCRKRSIEINCISQRLTQVDVFLRRLVWLFHVFKNVWNPKFWITKQMIKECIDPESNNIDDDLAYDTLESCVILPATRNPILNKKLTPYFEQKYLTYYVVWWSNKYANDDDIEKLNKKELVYSHRYWEFKQLLDKNFEELNKPKIKTPTKIDNFIYQLTHKDEIQDDIIKKQKEINNIQHSIKKPLKTLIEIIENSHYY